MISKKVYSFIVAMFAASLLSSCAVTTDTTESSSETFGNTSEATSDVTSSTSHKDSEGCKKVVHGGFRPEKTFHFIEFFYERVENKPNGEIS